MKIKTANILCYFLSTLLLTSCGTPASMPFGTEDSGTAVDGGPLFADANGVDLPSPDGGVSTDSGQAVDSKPPSSDGPVITTRTDTTCLTAADGTLCLGAIYSDGVLQAPNSNGRGTCHQSSCCLGCWDGSTCRYYDGAACGNSVIRNGLECITCPSGSPYCKLFTNPGQPMDGLFFCSSR